MGSTGCVGGAKVTADAGPQTSAYPAARHTLLDIGNPHLVLLVDDPAAVDLASDGRTRPRIVTGFTKRAGRQDGSYADCDAGCAAARTGP